MGDLAHLLFWGTGFLKVTRDDGPSAYRLPAIIVILDLGRHFTRSKEMPITSPELQTEDFHH